MTQSRVQIHVEISNTKQTAVNDSNFVELQALPIVVKMSATSCKKNMTYPSR
jgi:hypothetical protein